MLVRRNDCTGNVGQIVISRYWRAIQEHFRLTALACTDERGRHARPRRRFEIAPVITDDETLSRRKARASQRLLNQTRGWLTTGASILGCVGAVQNSAQIAALSCGFGLHSVVDRVELP